MLDDTHECPVGGCSKRVSFHHWMCRQHWRMVPFDLQGRLYRAYDNGRGMGIQEHIEAREACLHAVEAKLAARS